MNSDLSHFARQRIKEGLAQCTEEQQTIFRRMYSPDDLSLPIENHDLADAGEQ